MTSFQRGGGGVSLMVQEEKVMLCRDQTLKLMRKGLDFFELENHD